MPARASGNMLSLSQQIEHALPRTSATRRAQLAAAQRTARMQQRTAICDIFHFTVIKAHVVACTNL